MELKSKLALSVAAFIAASSPALADDHMGNGPKWDLAEVGYVEADIDGDDTSPSGFSGAFSKTVGKGFYLTGRYRDVSEDISIAGDSIEIEVSQLSLGAGYSLHVTDTTDVYGQLTFENLELGVSGFGESDSDDENGFGAEIGLRTMVTESFELGAKIGYLDVEDESETTFGASAYYYVTDNVAVGATYEMWEDVDFMGLNLRYAF
jgi:opacity protein-like surface antigen